MKRCPAHTNIIAVLFDTLMAILGSLNHCWSSLRYGMISGWNRGLFLYRLLTVRLALPLVTWEIWLAWLVECMLLLRCRDGKLRLV